MVVGSYFGKCGTHFVVRRYKFCRCILLFAALKKHGHGRRVKKKKKGSLLQISIWTNLETFWTGSRTSRFVNLCSGKYTWMGISFAGSLLEMHNADKVKASE